MSHSFLIDAIGIEAHGRPWHDRFPELRDATVSDSWYRDYPEGE